MTELLVSIVGGMVGYLIWDFQQIKKAVWSHPDGLEHRVTVLETQWGIKR